ncbi:hypothetical protein [Sphingomonas sp. LT1P40]|uniref:hypothetical protein n=1 Tax=Alteristakelama amylovorans TaxID=3096166 RepID=UPI002FC79A0A
MRAIALLPLLLLATACDRADDTTGVSAGEAAQLNAAADTLDINATEPGTPAPEE